MHDLSSIYAACLQLSVVLLLFSVNSGQRVVFILVFFDVHTAATEVIFEVVWQKGIKHLSDATQEQLMHNKICSSNSDNSALL